MEITWRSACPISRIISDLDMYVEVGGGIRDEERHVILTVFWKDSNELVSKLASAEQLAKRAEKQLAKGMRKNA